MILFFWLLFPIAAAIVASNKGRSGFAWFLLGLLLGPFGLIFTLIVSKIDPPPAQPPLPAFSTVDILDQFTKKCPLCAETIKLAAKKCRYCGEFLDPEQVEAEIAAGSRNLADKLAAGNVFCPNCRSWDAVPYAVLPDGGHGPWCPNCKRPLQ